LQFASNQCTSFHFSQLTSHTHSIQNIATNPDPRHSPDSSKESTKDSTDESSDQHESIYQGDNFAIEKINPDETHTLSYLLLESALHMTGNHLGSLWIRPDQSVSDDFKDAGLDQSTIGYPSRPLQLAKGEY